MFSRYIIFYYGFQFNFLQLNTAWHRGRDTTSKTLPQMSEQTIVLKRNNPFFTINMVFLSKYRVIFGPYNFKSSISYLFGHFLTGSTLTRFDQRCPAWPKCSKCSSYSLMFYFNLLFCSVHVFHDRDQAESENVNFE